MKKTSKNVSLAYAGAGSKKFTSHVSFKRKDMLIKNIEIIVACVVAFMAGTGLYELFK